MIQRSAMSHAKFLLPHLDAALTGAVLSLGQKYWVFRQRLPLGAAIAKANAVMIALIERESATLIDEVKAALLIKTLYNRSIFSAITTYNLSD